MKSAKYISLLLAICLSASILASCAGNKKEETTANIPPIESESEEKNESETSSSESASETVIETESETEKNPVIEYLPGDYGSSILYADNIKNGVQSYYPDGTTRRDYAVENLHMKAQFALRAGSEQKLTYLKNTKGKSYLENTMDVFIRMKNGKTYYASDSPTDARVNVYRIGYYYYDVHILEQNFCNDIEVTKQLKVSPSDFVACTNGSISAFKTSRELIRYTVSGIDPYISCLGKIKFSLSEYDTIRITVKSDVATSAQIFIATEEFTSYNAVRSTGFQIRNDGEYHTYDIPLSSFNGISGNVIGFRLDLGQENGEVIEVKDIQVIAVQSNAPNVRLDRTFHTYSDKVHQELHFVAPLGQDNIDAVGMVTEIPIATVEKLIVKDKNGTHKSLDGIDWTSAEYAGFDIKDTGVFGYILPYGVENNSLKITKDGKNYLIIQEAYPDKGVIESPRTVNSTENDFYMGHRLYTDESHTFDEFIKQAEFERHPLTDISSKGYFGYDGLRGAYSFSIGGTDFVNAFNKLQNQHYYAGIALLNEGEDRSIYIRTSTDSGCLEGAALMDSDGLLIPIPLEVSKNFSEGEEPLMNYGDVQYGETVFPLIATKGLSFQFDVVNIYQNWGQFPQKQLSSISYYAPYYHLSLGVTETSCISPWYVRGRTLWTLPDFRAVSAPYWFELEGSDKKSDPQHTHAGTPRILEYTDADGNYCASENYHNTIYSSGPIYAEVDMDYISDDGRMRISYDHLEMPQTDELRAYYTVTIDILENISFKNFKNDFSFYTFMSSGGNPRKLAYLDKDGKDVDKAVSVSSQANSFLLGKESPYFGLYDVYTAAGKKNMNVTNIGFLIHSAEMTIGASKFDGHFAMVQKANSNEYRLSLDLGEVTLKKGDKLTLHIIITPWGSQLSTDASNLIEMRKNTALDPYQIEAIKGEVIENVYMPRIKSDDGKTAEFTISGGANNTAVRVYGFPKLTAPKIYELIDGEWTEYVVSSTNTPDRSGNTHTYDGYFTYYDGDGTYSYAFVVNMDGVESRTFRLSAETDFEPWEDESGNSDPLNYYLAPAEIPAILNTPLPKGLGALTLAVDGSYIRFTGGSAEKSDEVMFYAFNATSSSPTGQYLVLKFRIPSENTESTYLQFFTSTENTTAKGTDSIVIPDALTPKDGQWHLIIVDAASLLPDSFKISGDGSYYCNYVRLDVFNRSFSANSHVDIAYFGISDNLDAVYGLASDMAKVTFYTQTGTKVIDPKTGEPVK